MALTRVEETDGYVDKLVKMVPAEAIAAYLALINIAKVPVTSADASQATLLAKIVAYFSSNVVQVWSAFFIALIILLVVRILGSATIAPNRTIDGSKVDWTLVIISVIAFLLWVYTIGGKESGPFKDFYVLFWSTALIILFTFLAPYLHTGTTRYFRRTGGDPEYES
jgi:hypothetical protein